jgi:hypothetical protein
VTPGRGRQPQAIRQIFARSDMALHNEAMSNVTRVLERIDSGESKFHCCLDRMHPIAPQ